MSFRFEVDNSWPVIREFSQIAADLEILIYAVQSSSSQQFLSASSLLLLPAIFFAKSLVAEVLATVGLAVLVILYPLFERLPILDYFSAEFSKGKLFISAKAKADAKIRSSHKK